VEVQRQLTSDLALSAAYVGSRTYRLDHNGAANTALTPGAGTPDQVNARKPFPWQSSLFMSIYDGRRGTIRCKFGWTSVLSRVPGAGLVHVVEDA